MGSHREGQPDSGRAPADGADERSTVDRRDTGRDAAEDAREEYTAYNERPSPDGDVDDEAAREADLQPGSPDSRQVDGEHDGAR